MSEPIPLLYKDRRLEGETTLRQCQLTQLHLLHVFDRICKENNLTYFLGGGTLLGAMRHKGFIPWDDDIDVGMPVKDYKRFLKIAKEALPKDVVLVRPTDTPKITTCFARLRDAYSFFCELRKDTSTANFLGIFLDIFPYDEMPEVGTLGKRLLCKGIGSAWHRKKYAITCITKCNLFGAGCLIFSGFAALVHLGLRLIFRILQMIFPCKSACLMLEFGQPFCWETKTLYPTKTAVFEDGKFSIPNDPDTFLTVQYGDWRKLPPVEAQRGHHAQLILPMTAQDLPMAMRYPLEHKKS